jgi:hypothetical protein
MKIYAATFLIFLAAVLTGRLIRPVIRGDESPRYEERNYD